MSARIPQADLSDIRDTIVEQFGLVPKPLETTWHHPAASQAAMEFGGKVASWDVVAEDLKSFAHIAVAGMIGCAWCLDYSYFHAMNEGLDMAKASQVPRWRETDVFTPLERDVLEYAEAMTSTPPTVTDALSARLLDQLGPAAVVELTAYVAFADMSSRNNVALGIESQGFSSACEIPLAARPDTATATA